VHAQFQDFAASPTAGDFVVNRFFVADVTQVIAEGSVEASRTSTALAELDETDSATYQFDIDWQLSPRLGGLAPVMRSRRG
jgi:hypothetical protein